jgi:hypothetical protein
MVQTLNLFILILRFRVWALRALRAHRCRSRSMMQLWRYCDMLIALVSFRFYELTIVIKIIITIVIIILYYYYCYYYYHIASQKKGWGRVL